MVCIAMVLKTISFFYTRTRVITLTQRVIEDQSRFKIVSEPLSGDLNGKEYLVGVCARYNQKIIS